MAPCGALACERSPSLHRRCSGRRCGPAVAPARAATPAAAGRRGGGDRHRRHGRQRRQPRAAAGTTGTAGTTGGGGRRGSGRLGGASGGAGGSAGAARRPRRAGGSAGAGGGRIAGGVGRRGRAAAGGRRNRRRGRRAAADAAAQRAPAADGQLSTLRLEYMNSSSTATTFSVRLTNAGPATPLISAIKVRYYFRDDSTNRGRDADGRPPATWKIASPSATFNLRTGTGCSIVATFAPAPQNAYVDFGCSLPSPMIAQDTITMSITIDPATQLAANDYSYADTAGAFAPNDHILLLLNGVVVAGTAP